MNNQRGFVSIMCKIFLPFFGRLLELEIFFSTDKNRKVIYVECKKYFWKEINVSVKSGAFIQQ